MGNEQPRRYKLNQELIDILGSSSVYYNPPETIKLKYPCIVYNLNSLDTIKANNNNYLYNTAYEITHIGRNPDDIIVKKILEHFKYSRFDREFIFENLYHRVFTIYY